PFCESLICRWFASQARCKLYVPCGCVNAVVEPIAAARRPQSKSIENELTPAPPGETRTNRQDCLDSPHLLVKKRHPQSRMRPEFPYAFRRHDCSCAPPRYASRWRPDLTTWHFASPTLRTAGRSACFS